MRALALSMLFACGGSTPSPAPPVSSAPSVPGPSAGIPDGYVDARVLQVAALEEGGAVLLLDEESQRVLPIMIGGTEAASIDLRMRRVPPPRPLTHDLLDTTIKKLGGRFVKVQIDALRDGIFHGSVFVRSGGRILALDARPSDALALAIGNKIPIYVARAVFEEAGLSKDELLRQITPPAGDST